MNELDTQRKIVLMKSSLVHWVDLKTAERLEQAIQDQQAHQFIRIAELDTTLNTAEIEGVYPVEKYRDLQNIKQGKWFCGFGTWHARHDTCACAAEKERERLEQERVKEMSKLNAPPTPEQQKENLKTMAKIRKELWPQEQHV